MPRPTDIAIVLAAYLILCASAHGAPPDPLVVEIEGKRLTYDLRKPTTLPSTQPGTGVVDVPAIPAGIHVPSGGNVTEALKQAPSGSVVYLAANGVYDGVTDTSLRLKSVTLAAYGTGAKPRIHAKTGLALFACKDVLIQGIEFTCDKPLHVGVQLLGCERVELKDCKASGFIFGVTSEAYGPRRAADIKLTNTEVVGCYNPKKRDNGEDGMSSGVYCDGTDGITITACKLTDNGWKEGVKNAAGNDHNHNGYFTANCTGLVVRDSLIARAAAFGIQARCGGIIENNLLLDCPTGLSFGYVNGGGVIVLGGVSGRVKNNTFLGERLMAGEKRGIAIVFGNCKADAVECTGNVFANDAALNTGRGFIQAAIKLDVCDLRLPSPHVGKDVRVNRIAINGNSGTWPTRMFVSNVRGSDLSQVQTAWPAVDVAQIRAQITK